MYGVQMTSRQGCRCRVVDRVALAEVVGRIVDASGGQAQAAKALKVRQPQVSKMLRQRVGGLTERTFLAVSRRCPKDLADRLQAAVLDTRAIRAIRHYQSWLLDQLAQYGLQANETLVQSFHRPDQAAQLGASRPLIAAGYTRDDLNPPWPTRPDHLVAVMLDNHDYKKLFADFQGKVYRHLGRSPETEIRIRLSMCRAVAPLLAGSKTDQVERTAEELHESARIRRRKGQRPRLESTDLAAYLKYALAAEEILLRRTPYFNRAQHATDTPAGANRLGAAKLAAVIFARR